MNRDYSILAANLVALLRRRYVQRTINNDRVEVIEDGLKKYPIFFMCGHTETTTHTSTETWENWGGQHGEVTTTKKTGINAEDLLDQEINSRLIFWYGCTAGVDGDSSYIDWVDLFIKHSSVPRVYIAPLGEMNEISFLTYVGDISRALSEGKTFGEAHASARYKDGIAMLFAHGASPEHTLNDLFLLGVPS